jgi:hypothetical protein
LGKLALFVKNFEIKISASIVESQACPAAGQGNKAKPLRAKPLF